VQSERVSESLALREVAAEEVLALRRDIIEIWPEASRDRLTEILPRHTSRDGFRFIGAFEDARLLGFVYGYLGGAGQWWHDRVAEALGAAGAARWLGPGHFEFTELHVRAERRRQGLGGTLHDAVLAGLAAPTAVLSTQTDNEPALALYGRRGWKVIVPYLDFGSGRPFLIMGKDLHARPSA
jgi:ribosomal protein S18 acetylase RimI-like enzyme